MEWTMERSRGFSVIETMLVLSLVGISVTLGLPALQGAMERNRVTLALHLLAADMAMARSSAVVRGRQVVVCPRRAADRCGEADEWTSGWLVFVDADGDRQPASVDDVLRATDAPATAGNGFALWSSRPYLRYQTDGRSAHSNLTVHVCVRDEVQGQVVVNNHGRARTVRPKAGSACPWRGPES
jgi:type IV fimbrial biogenesis protein FimT